LYKEKGDNMAFSKDKIWNMSEKFLPAAIKFLREIIAISSPSTREKQVAERICQEMYTLGFDRVNVDKYGSVIGQIGNGPIKLLYDAHIDTVGIGNPDSWDFDPFKGKEEDGWIWGRGASDNKGGLTSIIYGATLAKIIGLPREVTIFVVGSTLEEDSDGIAYKSIITERGLQPDRVVLSECTGGTICRGHRGRMELKITTQGVSSHASAPERGKNAIYKMIPIIKKIEHLNGVLKDDPFLGKGSIVVTKIENKAPSLNAVPDECTVYIDRRLTREETKETAIQELQEICKSLARVEILQYTSTAYTGTPVSMEKYYPTWVLDEDHPAVKSAITIYEKIFNKSPTISRWTFSTNGVYTMGIEGIPTIGFGPAKEEYSHSTQDRVSIRDIQDSMVFYAALPFLYKQE
jgi:putative selenium metabolism hydrolase